MTNTNGQTTAAVLTTESVHINLNKKPINNVRPITPDVVTNTSITVTPLTQSTSQFTSTPAIIDIPSSTTVTASSISSTNPGLRTIELSTGRIREGFANGDIIVTLLPVNTKWPWITPAVFRPELVPEELMAQGLTVSTLM